MTDREPANIMVVVDLQKDFIDGNLPATDGTRVVEPIKSKLTAFDRVYFTLDWHPWNHCSFKANGGIWPQHCVRYTVGAALPDGILDNLNIDNVRFLPKGQAQDKEEYGQFENTKGNDQDHLQAQGCGVGILASAHAAGMEELRQRPVYRQLLEQKVFSACLLIRRSGGERRYTLERLGS